MLTWYGQKSISDHCLTITHRLYSLRWYYREHHQIITSVLLTKVVKY